ncbi:MAG: tetratricopeptide repeat protein [Elusimicrobia bacterium]|nr:tetratricopeptide repeat protein [Elusimicrobiota bacterium]
MSQSDPDQEQARGPSTILQPLVESGRLQDAAAALTRLEKEGAPSWEMLLWRARIAEKEQRWDDALRDFRRAVAARPEAVDLALDLARFLEARGRLAAAQRCLRRAVKLPGRAGEARLALARLQSKLGRGAAALEHLRLAAQADPAAPAPLLDLARLSEGRPLPAKDLRRMESAARAALAAQPRQAGTRTILAGVLLAQGRPAQAESQLARALAESPAGVPEGWVSALLRLIAAGRYGRGLERAMLKAAPDGAPRSWTQVFSALLCAGRYPQAFRLAEAMLLRLGPPEVPTDFLWPWSPKARRAVGEQGFCAAELERVRRAGRGGLFPHWFAYCRAVLLDQLGRKREALAERRAVSRRPESRYCWMQQVFVLPLLSLEDFASVIAVSRRILRHSPRNWWVRCRTAEALLAAGRAGEGRRELEEAQRLAAEAERPEVLTWYGEVLLWQGRYREALAKFDESVRLGGQTFVYGWRGAARLKLGDLHGALADLDRARELDRKDFETLVWRGEAYRLLGRHAEALRELDAAVARAPGSCWGYFNRGLVRAALGDREGLAADLGMIPKDITAFLRRRLGLRQDRPLSPRDMSRLLAAGLDLARGIRRTESYLGRLWMRRRAPDLLK